MKVLIYGAGIRGGQALDLIKRKYKIDGEVIGFIDNYKIGQYQGYPIYRLEEADNLKRRILIALNDYKTAKDVCLQLQKRGYADIFWFQYKKTVLKHEDFFTEQCVNCKEWSEDILPQVEMHIMDSCNLNCRGCTHFSPIFSNSIPCLEARLSDVKQLKEKISCIMRFYILGGEPFLNPEINDYICGIRRILPYTQLYIVTNGLLIDHLSDETLQCIKENQVWISISEYQPTRKKIDKICQILDEYKILYEIREASLKEKFCLPLSLSKNSIHPKTCISNGCVIIGDGKIARCPQLMYISYFNNHFNTNLPEDGIMELEFCPTGDRLLRVLKEEVPLCRHCVQNEIPWSVCKKEVKLEDFAVKD